MEARTSAASAPVERQMVFHYPAGNKMTGIEFLASYEFCQVCWLNFGPVIQNLSFFGKVEHYQASLQAIDISLLYASK